MSNKKKMIIIVSLVLVVLIASGIRFAMNAKAKQKVVDLEAAAKKNLVESISVTGNIEAQNQEEITLSTMQKVTDIYVAEGQVVKAGDPLVKMDITDSEYQLKKANLNYDVAKISLNKLLSANSGNDKKALENSVQQAQINLSTTQGSYNDAKKKLEQNEELYAANVISKDEYDASAKAVSDLENQVKLLQLQLENAKNSLKDYDVNHADQIAQQSKQVEAAKADVENLASKLENGLIKANIDGKVVQMNAKKDQFPANGSNTILIYDLSKYIVNVEVSQYDAVSINIGQKAKIKVKGLDKEYTGTVSKISDAAEITMNGANKEAKVKVEITINNPDDKIKAGYETDADIVLTEANDALAVNFEAIMQDTDGKKYVFIIQGGKAKKCYVTTGTETDFDIQILDGLKLGQKYISNPTNSLKEGDPVRASVGGTIQ